MRVDKDKSCFSVNHATHLFVSVLFVEPSSYCQPFARVESSSSGSSRSGTLFEFSKELLSVPLSLVLGMDSHMSNLHCAVVLRLKSATCYDSVVHESNEKLPVSVEVVRGNVGKRFVFRCILDEWSCDTHMPSS